MGNNINWDKLRPSLVETSSCVRHVSNCYQDLKPGDHIEIQWRGNTQTPYGEIKYDHNDYESPTHLNVWKIKYYHNVMCID